MKQIRGKDGIFVSKDHDIVRHESLNKFVTGKAEYIDDLNEENGTLHAYIGKSDFARGKILDIDFKKVSESQGVVDIFSARDLPGLNDISPTGLKDEPVLADNGTGLSDQVDESIRLFPFPTPINPLSSVVSQPDKNPSPDE